MALMDMLAAQDLLKVWPTPQASATCETLTWQHVGTSAFVGLGFQGMWLKVVKGLYQPWSGARLPQECSTLFKKIETRRIGLETSTKFIPLFIGRA